MKNCPVSLNLVQSQTLQQLYNSSYWLMKPLGINSMQKPPSNYYAFQPIFYPSFFLSKWKRHITVLEALLFT